MDRAERIQRAITKFLQLTLVIAAGFSIVYSRWSIAFVSLAVLVTTFVPHLIERRTKIELPVEFEFVIIVFLYLSLFLGEVGNYYERFWWWDIFLHTGAGIAFGFIGFLILFILNRHNKIVAKPFWIAVFAFSFSVALGAMWEIFEFAMDQLLGMNMQKSGLVDTMWDLIVDSLGALLTSVAGYFYIKGSKGPVFSRLITKFLENNPRFND